MQNGIQVYTLPSCPHCKRVKAFLNEQGIKYIDHNVDNDDKAYNKMVKLTNQFGVPVTVINDDTVIVGDDLEKITSALENLAVSGEDLPESEVTETVPEEAEPKPEPVPEIPPVKCELVIIGSGAAGLSAAIYAGRKGLNTIVIGGSPGGMIRRSAKVENYPGITEISGDELMTKFLDHAAASGVNIIEGSVVSVAKEENLFVTKMAGGATFISRAVIAATGRSPRLSGAEGEADFIGRGVTFCASCDAPLYKDKNVAVFGGGNTAADMVLELADVAKEVHVITRSGWKADEVLVERLKQKQNIIYHHGFFLKSVGGKEHMEFVVIQKKEARFFSGSKKLRVEGLFIGIGLEPNTGIFEGLVELNEANEIIVNTECQTSCEGFFAAGGATSVKTKQIASSVGDGVKALISAFEYIRNQ